MSGAAVRAASLVVALASAATGSTLLVVGAPARHVAAATRALEAGDGVGALAALHRGVPAGDPGVAYLTGTALLATDDPAGAVRALSAALAGDPGRPGDAGTMDPELRRRVYHNLSVAQLRMAAGPVRAGRLLHARAAEVAAREELRLDPEVAGARWNLALARRLLEGSGRPQEMPDTAARRDGGVHVQGSVGGDGDAGVALTPAEARRILDALRDGEGASARKGIVRAFGRDTTSVQGRGPPW